MIVLTAIGVVTPRLVFRDTSEPPSLTVQLLPRITRIKTHMLSGASALPTYIKAATYRAHSPLIPNHRLQNPVAKAALIAPVGATSAPPGDGAGDRTGMEGALGYLPYGDVQRGVRALLRATVGCNNKDVTHASTGEREACAQRFGREARKAEPFNEIDPLKRAEYDAALRADADRIDGTKSQAALKSLQDARGGVGRAVHNDINLGVHCGTKFGPGAPAWGFGCGRERTGPPP